MTTRLSWFIVLATLLGACGDGSTPGGPDADALDGARDATVDAAPDAGPDAAPDAGPDAAPDAGPDAAPDGGLVFMARPRNPATAELGAPRGFVVARGLIHMHSVYSHDACDGEPLAEDGTPDWACHQRFRDGMCHNRHDFVLMTDHPDSIERRTLVEALYHLDGDQLEALDGGPVANRIACDDGHTVLLTAGSEGDLMPVLFKSMPSPGLLRDRSVEGIERLRAESGGLVFQAHMERFTGLDAEPWGLDGQEIYNIHTNLDPRGEVLATVMPDVARLLGSGLDGPHPDLWFTGIFRPGTAALGTWDWTIARTRMLGFAGSDTHENVPLPIDTGDGERIESYRRIGGWFSNRVLLDGPLSYATLRDALEAGRLYIVLDAFGVADGFDFRARGPGDAVLEMGAEAAFDGAWRLRVDAPRAPDGDVVEIRLLRVTEAGTEEIARTTEPVLDIVPPGPGAYRVEIWLTPTHLLPEMGVLADEFVRHQVWVYGNPIYLR